VSLGRMKVSPSRYEYSVLWVIVVGPGPDPPAKQTLMQGNRAKIHIKRTTSLHALYQAEMPRMFIRRLEIREAGKSREAHRLEFTS
jgi:hypothetical protein